jgi:hypothetical protein
MVQAAAALAFVLVGCADDGGPRLTAAMPASASHGTLVTLTGTRFCGPHADCASAGGEVALGLELPSVQAPILSFADTTAQISIPDIAPVGHTQLVMTVDDRSSNALDFEVLP